MMKKLQRILCADDEADMRMLIKLCLENVGGYDVLVCGSGRELLDNVSDWNPDLIILDAVMPLMDGPQTFAQLKAQDGGKHIPVLFMTGKAKEAEAELMASGAIGVVTKPFDPVHLATDIKNMWEASQNG